ncbi:hypothetical protein [Acinetobacter towneri]|uniref:hypothetical protein n=1 Tax=Acinetobacter towneri TaxID=202956 RepID=UPI00257737D2|nr:hypothetical protein [Acinetobacter towneri]MDM1721514.1 hypothetical protein [Acinetobacter towneri]
MKTMQNKNQNSYRRKLLAASIAAISTVIFTSSITQASDIDIYQEAKSGQITLMMMLDISTSMNGVSTARTDLDLTTTECSGNNTGKTEPLRDYNRTYCTVSNSTYANWVKTTATAAQKAKAEKVNRACNKQTNGDYHCGDRTARMLDAMYDLLNGNSSKGIAKLSDDKVIGLSTFGADNTSSAKTKIIVPARRLDCTSGKEDCYQMSGTKTQREILTEEIIKLKGISYTPTAWGYAEVINYLMGKRPNKTSNGFDLSSSITKEGSGTNQKYQMPASLVQEDANKKCSGQGIYVLTDGVPNAKTGNTLDNLKTGLSNSAFSCSTNDNWDCQHKAATELLAARNELKLVVKTAVVGFGKEFDSVVSYDRNKTKQQNLDALGTINTNPKNAAKWGIEGGGGWYSGSSSQDVVDSVNHFINDLSAEIPAVTTGSPTIPKDALNPAVLQDDAYYQQFQPTPDKTFQLWVGNLKKYLVDENGVLKGKNGNKIVDDDGKILDNFDYWAESITPANVDMDENTPGSTKFALRGGFWSKLALRTDPLNNPGTGTIKRKVFTDRKYSSGSAGDSIFSGISSGDLRQVKPTDLTDDVYKYDQYRGYLIRSLGYNIDAENPPTDLSALILEPEFRQTGAVMHSYPLMLTNKGKLAFNTTDKRMDSTNREDYILFGTTQGMLHVVKAGESGKAGGGEEVFTFIPNEMLEKQRKALDVPEATNGGMNNLFYGIDGPWTAYTEYVIDDSGNLTVGTGKGGQKGVQDVYGGLRMGGKSYYALNLQNINNPKLKFHIDPSGNCSNANPLGCMGQSWSKPTIGFVNWGGKRTRVMFVGGGYDMGYEDPDYNQMNKEGAGVYMFAAEDIGSTKAGDLLWWGSANATSSANTTTSGVVGTHHAEMQYSVVSEIRSVDRNGDDLIDHIYFGDLGGQIFRVDFDNTQSTIGKVVKAPVRLFDGHASGGKSPRFYDMPAFSLYSNNGNIFALISQGSGNRSKPLFADSSYEYDAIYNIYDKDVSRKDLFGATSWLTKDIEVSELIKLTDDDRKNDTTIKAPASSDGWYYEFTNCLTGHGDCDDYTKQTEKVFGTPVALNNKLFVSTFDASKDGLSGDCGAGVKGASLMTTFCLPYGQCKSSDPTGSGRSFIGAGIHTITVGNGNKKGGGSGSGSGGGSGGGSGDERPTSASNYCISTGGRMTITVTGAGGASEETHICLIPQRWYQKFR